MPERIREILDRVIAWWKKFSTKQKTLVISISAVVALSLVILYVVVSQPTMTDIIKCSDMTQAASVNSMLTDEGINFDQSNDGLTFSVAAEDEAHARMVLGSNDIPTQGYSIDDVTGGGFGTTEADKQKRFQVYLEDKLARMLETLDYVESAIVNLKITEDDGTIPARTQDTYVAAKITTKASAVIDEEQAASMAKILAYSVGNDTTDKVSIMDNSGKTLFAGGESSTDMGTTSSQLSYKTKVENAVKDQVKEVLIGTGVYGSVSIGLNMTLDFNSEEATDRDLYVNPDKEDKTQGYLREESSYTSSSQGGTAATPGTDSNNTDTGGYVIEDGDITSQDIEDFTKKYDLSEKITDTKKALGTMVADECSIAVVLTKYVVYYEDELKANGSLTDMTFDEYKAQNDIVTKVTTVDPELYTMVSAATNISTDKISITEYEVPFFEASQSSGRTLSDYLQIAMAVLIFVMLGYVVFRSTRRESEPELEPELSVEALLETTREAQEDLDDIGFNEKSETRLIIEKFVDENPEAVASLLRNWLNEEWN